MFTLIRLFTGIAILAFVICTVRDVKNRIANHEDNPYQVSSASNVASTVLGTIKDRLASRQSENGTGGFYGGSSGSNSNDNYRGGYLNSQTAASGTAASGTGKGRSTQETMCAFYPDQCGGK